MDGIEDTEHEMDHQEEQNWNKTLFRGRRMGVAA
jgi:hypothetical protein